jgi:hypothetical protein
MSMGARPAALEEWILRETGNAFERVVFLDRDLTLLYVVDGDVGETLLSEQDVKRWFGRVNLVTHNHPRETSFTDSDVFSTIALDARELNAFGPRVRYRQVRKPDGAGWPPREIAEAEIRRVDEPLRRRLIARVVRRELSPAQAEALHRRLRWTAFAQRFAADVDYVEQRR